MILAISLSVLVRLIWSLACFRGFFLALQKTGLFAVFRFQISKTGPKKRPDCGLGPVQLWSFCGPKTGPSNTTQKKFLSEARGFYTVQGSGRARPPSAWPWPDEIILNFTLIFLITYNFLDYSIQQPVCWQQPRLNVKKGCWLVLARCWPSPECRTT